MRRNQQNHKRISTKLVQRLLIYTWYLPFNLLPSSFFLLPSSFFFQLIAGNTFRAGGQLHCTGDSNGYSFVKNRGYNVLFVKLGRTD
jgi:hypothetical protein